MTIPDDFDWRDAHAELREQYDDLGKLFQKTDYMNSHLKGKVNTLKSDLERLENIIKNQSASISKQAENYANLKKDRNEWRDRWKYNIKPKQIRAEILKENREDIINDLNQDLVEEVDYLKSQLKFVHERRF